MLSAILKGLSGKYKLIVIHPSHFLTHGSSVEIKHPVTQELKCFSINSSLSREESTTGPHLPAFSSRGKIRRDVPLNPILVNFAAVTRFKRLIHNDPAWGSDLDDHTITTLREVVRLHKAVTWDPTYHPGQAGAPIPIQMPDSKKCRDLDAWPFPPAQSETPKPGPSSSGDLVLDMLDLMESLQGSFYHRLCLIANSNQGFYFL